MRPVNQLPLSLKEMKRSPLASSRMPDSPPKPGNREVSARPLRNCSEPNRTCERSGGSNVAIGRALTSIEAGAVTECSSSGGCFAGGCVADCARSRPGIAANDNPAAADRRKRRRGREQEADQEADSGFALMRRKHPQDEAVHASDGSSLVS